MAETETCKRTLDITVPADEVEAETARVVENIRKKVKLPGFRPGKVPLSIIEKRFESDIRQQVIEALLPKYFQRRAESDGLKVVGSPNARDVQFRKGEPLRFTVDFEVAPDFELGDYRNLTVTYSEAPVTEEDVAARLEALREEKAEYVNIDPRPAEDGDYAVISLRSIGLEGEPIEQNELRLLVGGEDTLPAFTENLRGMSPGEEKEFDVPYPEDYAQPRLAGKTVRFHAVLKAISRRELPELGDEFARDLGDYQNLEELRDEVRRTIAREREYLAKQASKQQIIEKLVDMHPFPVPKAFVDQQIEAYAEQYLRGLAARGVDPRSVKLDWEKLAEKETERAVREVRASMILDRIGDREAIAALTSEVDQEVQRIARQEREPVAAVRMRLQKEGAIRRIANRIRTEKILNFLFEHARKEVGE